MPQLALQLSLQTPGSIRGGAAPVAAIVLSANTIAENATAGTTVGTLSTVLTTGTAVFSLVDSAGSRFALSGAIVQRGATGLDYETATSHNIIVSVTGVTPAIANTTLTINVTDIVEAVWTPADLGSALKLWLKADTGITLNGGDVAAWADQSGNGTHVTQGTGANQPAYQATGFNGLPTVNFTAANADVLRSGATAMTLGNATASFFVVGQMLTGTLSYGRALSFLGPGDTVDYADPGSASCIIRDDVANAFITYAGGATRCTAVALSLATNYRIGMIYGGASVTPYLNNVAGTPGAYSTAFDATGKIGVGGDANTGSNWAGPISEVVITNTALSSGDRLSLDNYFKTKWGL